MPNKVILVGGVSKIKNIELKSMYQNGKSIHDIHNETGVPLSTVRGRLQKLGVLRNRGDAVRLADLNGRIRRSGNKTVRTKETREKQSIAQLKKGDTNARGISCKPSGYIEITRGVHKGKSLHVVIMEKRIGRKLRKDEVVHHKDGIRSNNDPSNLELMDKVAHLSMHRKMKPCERNNKGQFKGLKKCSIA